MKKVIFLIFILCKAINLNAQNLKQQKVEFATINIGLNGLLSGLGALANKKKGENNFKVFLKGFGQGCLGSTFQIMGKELTYQINKKQNLSYAWTARITNSIGSSIIQNAASNINFWERWHFNLGLIRFDYQVKNKKLQTRFFPSSLYGAIRAGSQARFNLRKSLQSGIMIFERDGSVTLFGRPTIGFAQASSIAIDKNITGDQYYELMAHEVFHILQYDNMVWVNPFLNKMDQKLKATSKLYQKASKYVYFDFNGLTLMSLYLTQINQPWQCRFIEREADLYSKRIGWPDCK